MATMDRKLIKLYEVPDNSRIRIEGLEVNGVLTEELNFHHIDGMFSYCVTDNNEVVHLSAFAECEIIEQNK